MALRERLRLCLEMAASPARWGLLAALLVTSGGALTKASRPTYRMLEVQCPRCDLLAAVRRLAAPDAAPCTGEDWKNVSRCIASAQSRHRPFVATVRVSGLDSAIAYAFVGTADGTVDQLWYDSDPSGGCTPCNAVIVRTRCAPFDPNAEPGHGCTATQRYVLCSEASHRTITLAPPRDASDLFCPESAYGYSGSGFCSEIREPGTRAPLPDERVVCLDSCLLTCSRSEGSLLNVSHLEETAPPVKRK